MRIQITKLTPKKAAQLLEKKASNRPLSMQHVRRLAGAMADGRWVLNGETIKIDTNGQVQDGQHRLHAIIMSGVDVETAIAHGVPATNGAFESIDTGKRRSVSDMFARAGKRHYCALAAATGWLWRLQSGSINKFDAPRHDQAMEVLNSNPGLEHSVEVSASASKVLVPGLGGCLHYLFAQKDPDKADEFFHLLASGEFLTRDGPTSGIYRLREKLLDDRSKRIRPPMYVYAAMAIKAWNAYRKHARVKSLRFGSGEEFPVVQ